MVIGLRLINSQLFSAIGETVHLHVFVKSQLIRPVLALHLAVVPGRGNLDPMILNAHLKERLLKKSLNPHAHILLTVRPLDEHGNWQYKTEKEYLCVKGDDERGFTAAEFAQAKLDGWKKQYPYKVGCKKVYMAPSVAEAQGLVRASKYPKNTRYGRQNLIAERWNSESQLLLWRAAWAETSNRHLEFAASEARIDHRSNAERGIDEQPTVHEGVDVRMIEKRGGTSALCELNRQIRADNALLRALKKQVQKLVDAAKQSYN